ncbi:serine protease [Roseomonas sp. E05]|uniref:S1 family peptidase n=1 Tax=Roseomonas sp. E05 TaxID=3046310 RepID=UPI0024BA896E|nr:serine protease [Roseomonas sp. E05]MDJ0386499.1 serine protease [Roseomonas sp. E05]
MRGSRMQAANGRRSFLQGMVASTLGLPALLSGCAAPVARLAQGTPVEQITTASFATLQSNGLTRGGVVGFDGHHVLTCAHVLEAGAPSIRLRRADGAETAASLVARSGRMDLAVLRVAAGFLAPAERAEAPPRRGELVWAAGAPSIGSPIAQGHVEAPDAEMPGFGRGFTARMPALMGYSGGPVVDEDGQLLGLTAALPQPGAAGALAFLLGADIDGLAQSDRQVFVLSIRRAEAEARRLLGAAAA